MPRARRSRAILAKRLTPGRRSRKQLLDRPRRRPKPARQTEAGQTILVMFMMRRSGAMLFSRPENRRAPRAAEPRRGEQQMASPRKNGGTRSSNGGKPAPAALTEPPAADKPIPGGKTVL